MSTWVQYEKSIASCIHRIRNKRTHSPGRPPFFTLHHPPTPEASTCPTFTNHSYKNCTQLDSLPSELLHNIDMWRAGLVNHIKLKPVLVQITQYYPVLCASTFYKLKYPPFDYFMHYYHIRYV